ncbi:cytochrome c-type biogenesis protein CcmH [Flagellatimonas centrodinii]|uniref:cytochrome c-type biogenesis protein n=1 Tax=Flagellatimonas centrodinii TaxID=2806210 RepID=UPI001FFA459A|nr:cytochrome c-type biogenesis protein [Flagellatimonas centrodinii]ULQ46489.1 cytochrome c-type biogenesis protein CcmH [Flagellatimonas centrodinii]
MSRMWPGVMLGGLMLTCAAVAETPAVEADRYQRLIHELRCLVCQNQSIAESNAPLAQDLREQVATQLAAGRSDDQIRDYLTDRYGDFVLYRPPFRWRTALLWLGPFLLVLVGLAVVWRQGRRVVAAPAPPDADALKRLLEEHRR